MVGVTYRHTKGHTMNPYLIHQMAQARQADLLREAEEYRRAGLAARRTILRRVTARIPRITARDRSAPQACGCAVDTRPLVRTGGRTSR